MGRETDTLMEDPKTSDTARLLPPHTPEHEKGSLRSMWELIMQLRVLLPYLTRLVPLLDKGLLKAAPDLTDVRAGLDAIKTGSRDLNTQVASHSLQLEKMEQQLSRLREAGDRSHADIAQLSAGVHSLNQRLRAQIGALGLALALLIALLVLQILHFAR